MSDDKIKIDEIIKKFKNIEKSDINNLQIHVIFNYTPLLDKSNYSEPTSNNQQISQLSDTETGSGSLNFKLDFINSMIKNTDNVFNFSLRNKEGFILEKNISTSELDNLLPELNKYIYDVIEERKPYKDIANEIVSNKNSFSFMNVGLNSAAASISKKQVEKKESDQQEKDKAKAEAEAIKKQALSFPGGTRITKRQKKIPQKRNKHHTAKKQT